MKTELSITEENYIKSIYHLSAGGTESVSTNSIAQSMSTTAASVSDMLRKLSEKKIADYEKYKGVALTELGLLIARRLVRAHRLWEVFLSEKLGYQWHEVHELAEKLEHIRDENFVERLDNFLGNPQFDPHGDPIPDVHGNIQPKSNAVPLSTLPQGVWAVVVGVKNSSSNFLQYLDSIEIALGTKLKVTKVFEFDSSVEIKLARKTISVSAKAAEHLLVEIEHKSAKK
jgi:DtxR family Mn-dependent transcriptional regulator